MVDILTVLVTVLLATSTRSIPLTIDETIDSSNDVRAAPKVDYRLPTKVIPSAYKLTLIPHLQDKFDFDGNVEIGITTAEAKVDKIVLHAASLTIRAITLTNSSGQPVELINNKGEIDTTTDFLTIKLKTPLDKAQSKYTLKINYTGSLIHDDWKGFYRSYYVNDAWTKVWLATTKFEPVFARRAFPCFDEPAFKATFELTIQHPKKLQAISNMPKKSTTKVDTTTSSTTFEVTPVMSTYLLAFVISDFQSLSANNGTFNVWARPNVIRHGQFALEHGQKALKALETYTGIPYNSHGFGKMDNIAIPQFPSGAMENWAFVTYKESGLLVEEGVTTTSGKEGVATVISHEFAHQWFGDLVGPEWWTYTWLNEGFANYLQYIITDQFLPAWRLKEQLVVKSLQASAFTADAVSSAHEMDWLPSSSEEIISKFDTISYHKAGSIIRMIDYVLGNANFKAALTNYLKTNSAAGSKKVANSAALFKELKAKYSPLTGAKVDLEKVLINWTNNPGFPVINVTRNYKTGKVNITQARFLLKANETQKQTYYVPFNYAQQPNDFKDVSVTGWLTPDKPLVDYDANLKDKQWVVFNKEHFGYYRVNYDKTNWDLLTKFLQSSNFEQIPKINRAQLVDDALNLARVGQLEYQVALDLIKYLKAEYDYIPWYSAFQGLGFLQRVLASSKIYSNFKTYVLELTDNLVKNVTFNESEKDEHVRKYLRVDALSWACKFGSKSCRDTAASKVSSWLASPKNNKLSPDTKNVILCGAVRNYNQTAWEKLLQKYVNDQESGVQTALGCTSNTNILNNYLIKILDDESILDRDSVIAAVYSGSEEGVDVALDFVLTNADKIYKLSGNKTDNLKTYIKGISQRMTNQAQLDKLKKNSNKHIIEIRGEAVTSAQDNLDWLKAHEQELIGYFTQKKTNTNDKDSAVTFTVSSVLLLITLSISQLY